MAARLLEQHRQDLADAGAVESRAAAHAAGPASRCSRSSLTSSGTCPAIGCRRAGTRAVLERERAGEADLAHQLQRRLEIGFALAGEADDEIRRQRQVGPRGAQPRDDAMVVGGTVAAIHRGKDAVGAGLHRQVQERHQLRFPAVRRDQRVVDVARVRGRVAQPIEPVDRSEPGDQLAEPDAAPAPSTP